MSSKRRRPRDEAIHGCSHCGAFRLLSAFVFAVLVLAHTPVVSAHGTTATGGLAHGHGTFLALGGLGVIAATIVYKRIGRLSPTAALSGVFVGLVMTALGAILFEALSPETTYSGATMPFPRSWYLPLALSVGFLVIVASLVIGRLRWPTRPRYSFLGILAGLWIAYPYLLPGNASDSHPLGYAIVLGTPILVGYVVWKDVGTVLRSVLRDRAARWFGIGVGIVVALFFVSITGYLSFFPEEGLPHERVVVVLPAIYQLVTWPTLEVYLPHVPLFVAISPGQLIVVGLLSTLVGLNAAVIARHWRVEERAGMTQSTAGAGAIVGSCTCGCCGPLVAKVAVLSAGPSIAAPLYWVFVDTASPLSALFIVASIVLFVGSLVYSVETARQSGESTAVIPAD
ncbi:hypothetical protein SAMN05421858_3099 [Haladaptatus litoreus]|uniref:Uncharacterized protein n=1 Tax=Haladaptatus litoreus TaxID=553468 RepID=A0A1N7CMB1_9EURY|nr:hypothetical protein [Haladaptatus litoreus]SIR64665.1 hypothetical protein SAMN05421858_3099 [Haladaptatus litoreus]